MNPKEFNGRGTVDISRGYSFYVPGNIPRSLEELNLTEDTLYYLAEAESSLGNLSGTGRNLPNPHLLISPYMKREAVLSSKIEGTKASLTDLYEFEADNNLDNTGDAQEVKNYANALEYGRNQIEKGAKIDVDLIKELHKILMKDVAPERGAKINEGVFRSVQNRIGGTNLETATYVPPAPDRVEPLMRQLISFINNPPKTSELINIGLIHYQFEAIHPFSDGNGRIGRLLIILYLLDREKLSEPLLYLSAYFNRTREEYYDRLLEVSKEGNYDSWTKYFLKGIKEQSEDALIRAKKLDNLREKYISEMREKGKSDSLIKAVEFLFQKPVYTINDMAGGAEEMSYSTANRATQKLLEEEIVSQVGDRERNKRYRCGEILSILEEEDMKFDEEETRQITLSSDQKTSE